MRGAVSEGVEGQAEPPAQGKRLTCLQAGGVMGSRVGRFVALIVGNQTQVRDVQDMLWSGGHPGFPL